MNVKEGIMSGWMSIGNHYEWMDECIGNHYEWMDECIGNHYEWMDECRGNHYEWMSSAHTAFESFRW